MTPWMPSIDGIWARPTRIKWEPFFVIMIFRASLLLMSFYNYLMTYNNLLPEYPLNLTQLQQVTRQLAAHSFRPGTSKKHVQQDSTFIKFCDNYNLPFIMPSMSTICCYITQLTHHFKSTANVCTTSSGSGSFTRNWAWPRSLWISPSDVTAQGN